MFTRRREQKTRGNIVYFSITSRLRRGCVTGKLGNGASVSRLRRDEEKEDARRRERPERVEALGSITRCFPVALAAG